MKSPFDGIPPGEWRKLTEKLIARHPLKSEEIAEVVLTSWDSIFESRMGSKGFRIGVDIFPKPQIMGFLLHELVPLELAARYPSEWRVEKSSGDKDIVYVPDGAYSIELKTSSNPSHIYGNRSYAQKTSTGKKAKSGYYLAVNFEKFAARKQQPRIRLIRFGWLDSSDWVGQNAPTGQQSRLPPDVENYKLIELYSIR